MSINWVLESSVFGARYAGFRPALEKCGARVVEWEDGWLRRKTWPSFLNDGPTTFHGSLGNAAALARVAGWTPGPYCDETAFRCSSWHPAATSFLPRTPRVSVPANVLCAEAARVLAPLGDLSRGVFVRPDSPLKPFSGRVLAVEKLSLAALDHGFYFDDETLPVIASPVIDIGAEWRFLVVGREIVSASGYAATGRSALDAPVPAEVVAFASGVASALPPPQAAYVLDVCETAEGLRLLELNPFSGADLYAMDLDRVASALCSLIRAG